MIPRPPAPTVAPERETARRPSRPVRPPSADHAHPVIYFVPRRRLRRAIVLAAALALVVLAAGGLAVFFSLRDRAVDVPGRLARASWLASVGDATPAAAAPVADTGLDRARPGEDLGLPGHAGEGPVSSWTEEAPAPAGPASSQSPDEISRTPSSRRAASVQGSGERLRSGTPSRASPRSLPPAVTPVPARLFISSQPWGRVHVDGRLVGNTPQSSLSLPPGEYRIRVERPGFHPFEQNIRLAPGEEMRLTGIRLQAVTP